MNQCEIEQGFVLLTGLNMKTNHIAIKLTILLVHGYFFVISSMMAQLPGSTLSMMFAWALIKVRLNTN